MLYLEKMKMHTITSGNYVTSVHGMVHPNRIIGEHDFLYILDGTWEIWEDDTSYALQSDDLLILTAGRHHYGKKLCNPGNRHMYVHVLPTDVEKKYNHLYPSAVDPSEAFRLFSCSSLLHCQHNPKVRQYMQEIISDRKSTRLNSSHPSSSRMPSSA